jgi:4-amino-4-deoxy-L-arabinose transferase-like glycosyltransferase
MLPRLALPPSHAVLVLIALAFVAPGLIGHDPWRAFDVITIEIVQQMHLSGDWVVPRVAGEPFLEDPPFYHWTALAFAKALGWLLGFHNAVRLASGVAMMAALWFLYLAARHSALPSIAANRDDGSDVAARRGAGAAATLLLVGAVGLMMHAHEAVPDLATLAASCAALCFLFSAKRKPGKAGLAFGASLGIAFLSTGLVMPAVLAATALLAHLACDEWRGTRALRFLAAAAGAFAVLAASWPLALFLRSPELAQSWWYGATHARGDFGANLRYYLVTASWFAWPAWPLALWSAWTLRREWRSPRVFVPLAAALLALPAIAWAGPRQDINTMALLAPLALLGAHGVARLRRGAANLLDWFGAMTFTFFAGLVWLGYIAMMTGVPPRIANNFAKTAPGFLPQFEFLPFAAALLLTLAWLYLAFFTAPSPTRGVVRWAAGVALLWGTFATLWLPWADHLKSYRGVALQLKSTIPTAAGCIAQSELATPQRAALSFHAGIRTEPLQAASPSGTPKCRYAIVQGHPRRETTPGPGWRKLADVGRPGDRGERYRLYRYGPG